MYNPPEGKDYKLYISGIYCQLGDYISPTWWLTVVSTTVVISWVLTLIDPCKLVDKSPK